MPQIKCFMSNETQRSRRQKRSWSFRFISTSLGIYTYAPTVSDARHHRGQHEIRMISPPELHRGGRSESAKDDDGYIFTHQDL